MTFVRHLWTSLIGLIRTFFHFSFKYRVLVLLVCVSVYMENYGALRTPYSWYFIYYHTKAFLIKVFVVLMPIAYLHCRLVFGTLYPAYASYKAVKTKNVKEYMKWMMYWIVFALFTAGETFADVFLSWFPFYYEIKMVFVFWLLSPVTRGSSLIYRKFVHPQLNKREKEIDEAIAQARTKGYSTLLTLGTKGLTLATKAVVTTAMKGQSTLVEQYKKSYSTNDLRVRDVEDEVDAPFIDDSDEEFAIVQSQMENSKNNVVTSAIIQSEKEKPKARAKPKSSAVIETEKEKSKARSKTSITESRLLADNKELDRREKQQQRTEKRQHRRPIQRSKSDAGSAVTQIRRPRPATGLSKVEEAEHESSMAHSISDDEPVESYSEEIIEIYHSPGRPGHYTSKQVKADPYATLPRTRSRHRPRLNQNI